MRWTRWTRWTIEECDELGCVEIDEQPTLPIKIANTESDGKGRSALGYRASLFFCLEVLANDGLPAIPDRVLRIGLN